MLRSISRGTKNGGERQATGVNSSLKTRVYVKPVDTTSYWRARTAIVANYATPRFGYIAANYDEYIRST